MLNFYHTVFFSKILDPQWQRAALVHIFGASVRPGWCVPILCKALHLPWVPQELCWATSWRAQGQEMIALGLNGAFTPSPTCAYAMTPHAPNERQLGEIYQLWKYLTLDQGAEQSDFQTDRALCHSFTQKVLRRQRVSCDVIPCSVAFLERCWSSGFCLPFVRLFKHFKEKNLFTLDFRKNKQKFRRGVIQTRCLCTQWPLCPLLALKGMGSLATGSRVSAVYLHRFLSEPPDHTLWCVRTFILLCLW